MKGTNNPLFCQTSFLDSCKSSSGTRTLLPAYLDIEDGDPNNVQMFVR
jgi:hypothetical protein